MRRCCSRAVDLHRRGRFRLLRRRARYSASHAVALIYIECEALLSKNFVKAMSEGEKKSL